MAENSPTYGSLPTGVLLGMAQNTYRSAIRVALVEAGYDDMPRNGPDVLSGIVPIGNPLGELIKQIGVSKQAAGQLIGTLVARGYLDRSIDVEDRRRLKIGLTERGRAVVDVIKAATDQVDAQLVKRVGPQCIAHTLATLAVIIEHTQQSNQEQRLVLTAQTVVTYTRDR